MTEEGLFEFAREKGWDKLLDIARSTHSLADVAARVGKKERDLDIELRAMQALGLVQLAKKPDETYCYITTGLGLKFLQEENKKKGLTYTCQLCGTTTGVPHICSVFCPELG